MVEKIYDFHEDFSPPGYADLFYAKGQKARVLDTDVQDLIEAKPSRATNLTALDILSVDTIADLKALDPTLLGTANRIHVLGYTTASDGGARVLVYDSTSTATANDVSIFAPDSGDGRYIHNGPIWPECAGCDKDAADNSTALQRLADANVDVAGRGRAFAYPVTSGITLAAGFSARWENVWVDGSAMTSNGSIISGTGADFTSPVNLTASASAGDTALTVASGDESGFDEGKIALIHQKKNWAGDQMNRGMNSDWHALGVPADGQINLASGLHLDMTTGDASITISGITRANPGVITATSHGLTVGEIYEVTFSSIAGMTELNGTTGYVEVVDANSVKMVTAGGGNTATDLTDITFSNLSGYFKSGETVNFAPSSAVGTITSISNSGGTMTVRVSSGTPAASDGITGATTSATATADTVADQYTAYSSGGNMAYAAATARVWQSVFSPKFHNCGIIGNPQRAQFGFDFLRAYRAEIFNCHGVNLRDRFIRLKVDIGTRADNNFAELDRVVDTGITGITAAQPPVVTSVGHGLQDGARIVVSEVSGTTEVNGNTYYVGYIDANSYQLENSAGDPIDGTGFTAYTSGGQAEIDYGSRYMVAPNGGYGGMYGSGKGRGIRHIVAYGASGSGSGNTPDYIVQRNCQFGDIHVIDGQASPADSHGGACDVSFGNIMGDMRVGDDEDAITLQGCRLTVGNVNITSNRSIGVYIQNIGYGDETPEDSENGRPNFVRMGHVDITDCGSQTSSGTNSIFRLVNLGKTGGKLHEVTVNSFSATGREGIYLEPRNGDIGRVTFNGGTVIARDSSAFKIVSTTAGGGATERRIERVTLNNMHLENSDETAFTVDIDNSDWFTDFATGMSAWVTFNDCVIKNAADREAVNARAALLDFNRTQVLGTANNSSTIQISDDHADFASEPNENVIGVNGFYYMQAVAVSSNTIRVMPNCHVEVDTSGGAETINKALLPSWLGYYSGTHDATHAKGQSYKLTIRPSSGNNVTITNSTTTVGGFKCAGGVNTELSDADDPACFEWNPTPSNERWIATSMPPNPGSVNLSTTAGTYKILGNTRLANAYADVTTEYRIGGTKVVGSQVTNADLAAPNSITAYTAATVSAGYVQAEVQTIADALETLRDEVADVRDKAAASNSTHTTHGLGVTS